MPLRWSGIHECGEAINILLLWSKTLAFGVLEDGVADFGAVGDRQDANFLALASVLQQDGAIWRESLLNGPIIEEFARVFYGSATRIPFFVLEPEHSQRFGADVKTSFSFFLINQVNYEKIQSFLLVLADKRDSRTAFLVTQQGVDTVVMLRKETRSYVLSRCERSAVDETPEFSIPKDE